MLKKSIVCCIVIFNLIILIENQPNPLTITLITPLPNSETSSMYSNGTPNSNFTISASTFNCSTGNLYTYLQTPQELSNNTPYNITFNNFTSSFSLSVTTKYGSFNPNISVQTCTTSPCDVIIWNNCNPKINFFNYYDQVQLTVSALPQILTYNVLCNNQYISNTFEWGMLIEIVVCTVIIAIVAVYSKAWSLGGNGIAINIWLIILFNVLIIAGGIIGYFSTEVIQVILDILSFIVGIFGVYICAN